MIQVTRVHDIGTCEGDHPHSHERTPANICIEGAEDAMILVCAAHAIELVAQIQAVLAEINDHDR